MANPLNSSPNFNTGGSVFSRIAAQWNAYFGAKVDSQSGQMDSPTITGSINAVTAALTVGQLHVASGTLGGLAIPPLAVSGSGATLLVYDRSEFLTSLSGSLQLVAPIKTSLLAVATATVPGIVLPDNSTITVDGVGRISTNAASLAAPTGQMSMFAGAAAPPGWLICNGQAVSRSTYNALFAVVGTAYGPGDGSTTFNVPDMRGRVGVGYDPSVTTGRMTQSTSTGLSAANLGNTGGEQDHYLSNGELAGHQHGIADPGHAHYISDPGHTHPDVSHSHRVNDPGHAHNIYDPGHAHGVADPGHSHGVSDGGHSHTYYANDWAATWGQGWSGGDGGPVLSANTLNTSNNGSGIGIQASSTGIGIYGSGTGIGIYGSGTGIYLSNSTSGIGGQFTGIGSTQGAGININQTQFSGQGFAHNNVQPGLIVNYIVKT